MIVERLNTHPFRGQWKYPDPLIIKPDMLKIDEGDNINGPSLIKVPSWVKDPLGKYYLYFSHHDGKYIRLAYADEIQGPYKIYDKGTLHVEDTPGKDHVASPDVHIDEENKKIVLYYHTPYDDWQYTFKAESEDGLNFTSEEENLGMFYFRVFKWKNRLFSIAKNKNISGILYECVNGKWKPITNLIGKMRHAAVLVEDDVVNIFYTIVGEAPESIYRSTFDIDKLEITSTEKILYPLYNYEGSDLSMQPSTFGSGIGNQLRDPCIYSEDNTNYILYTVAGEAGIAIGKLHNTSKNIKKYNVWGMRRSGNHAIIEWLANHFDNTFHENDIINNRPWVTKIYNNKNNIIDCHIRSKEDFAPRERDIGPHDIIILRDWYNMSASRLVSGRGWKSSSRYPDRYDYIRSCEEVYLEYCRLWEKYPDNFILYNKWCEDPDYVKEIESRYGWKNINRQLTLPKSGIGEGSSFKDNSAENSYNERFEEIIDNYPYEWIDICSNKEINEYSKKIFGIEVLI